MGIWILETLAISLALTIVLELGFGMILGIRNPWDMTLVILVNLLTNPAVVFLYYVNLLYMGQNQAAVTAALEIGAAAAEGLCYRAASRRIRRPWLFSAGANLFSFTVGATITSLAGR